MNWKQVIDEKPSAYDGPVLAIYRNKYADIEAQVLSPRFSLHLTAEVWWVPLKEILADLKVTIDSLPPEALDI